MLPEDAIIDPASVNPAWMHAQSFLITGTRVSGHGLDDSSAASTDLLMWNGRLEKDVCVLINEELGVDNPSGNPPIDNWDCGGIFTGSYSACSDLIGDEVTSLSGKDMFCVQSAAGVETNYFFMNVMLAR